MPIVFVVSTNVFGEHFAYKALNINKSARKALNNKESMQNVLIVVCFVCKRSSLFRRHMQDGELATGVLPSGTKRTVKSNPVIKSQSA